MLFAFRFLEQIAFEADYHQHQATCLCGCVVQDLLQQELRMKKLCSIARNRKINKSIIRPTGRTGLDFDHAPPFVCTTQSLGS